MYMIVGSYPLKLRYYTNYRKPNDIDIIGTYDDCVEYIKEYSSQLKRELLSHIPTDNGKKLIATVKPYGGKGITIIECELAWEGTTAFELLTILKEQYDGVVPSLASDDVLYTLKMSHRYLKNSPHFRKTMDDIKFLRDQGAVVPEYLKEWFKKREKETYTYSHPNLNVTKGEFFKDDQVPYKYDHDSIHEAVKHLSVPAYTLFKEPGAEVKCSKDLFDLLPEKYKLYAVLEEAYVLALERSQIPNDFNVEIVKSFDIALEKICTSITSGWFREFAWENYRTVKAMFDETLEDGYLTYVDDFLNGLERGIIKEFSNTLT